MTWELMIFTSRTCVAVYISEVINLPLASTYCSSTSHAPCYRQSSHAAAPLASPWSRLYGKKSASDAAGIEVPIAVTANSGFYWDVMLQIW